MSVRNAHFYSRNEGCAYPLDDAATAVDDRDTHLPSSIIVDMNLRWPEQYGRYAFVSSVTVTGTIVSVTIQAATALNASTFSPLAVVSVPQPVELGRQYALEGQVEGCGGWIVFGRGIREAYRGRFSAPTQSHLLARTAKAYRALPIGGLRSYDAGAAMQGIVKLNAQEPLEIVKESRDIDGVVRDCVVLRLVEDAGLDGNIAVDSDGNPVTVNDASVFREFGGPCSGRPESRSCGDPQPVEFLDVVGPDCDGVLTVEFRGCANVVQILGTCGVAVDCGLGLSSACTPAFLPNSEGKLPSEYDAVVITPPTPPIVPEEDLSETIIESGSLPYADCFKDREAQLFSVKSGLWGMEADNSNLWLPCPIGGYSESLSTSVSGDSFVPAEAYTYATLTAAGRCITVWDGFDVSTLGRRFTADVKLTLGPDGASHNAGLVINYRPHASQPNRYVYHYAEIDFDSQQVRLSRFNGGSIQTAGSAAAPGIVLGEWYKITVEVEPGTGNTVNITARFQSRSDATVDVTIGPVGFNNFYPSEGLYGFGTYRAVSRFAYFELEQL